ncbi:MAG TPA: radical SAM protein [Polyangia bacterium]
MRLALIYPPTCDPTAPYLSLPALLGAVRAAGIEAHPVDANLEAWLWLLRGDRLGELAARVTARLGRLDARPALRHAEQVEYATLAAARPDAATAPGTIADALATLRDPARFFDPAAYAGAVATVEAAARLVAAAHAPLELSFRGYRTPFGLLTADEIRADAAPGRDPFHGYWHGELIPALARLGVDAVGLSAAFPGQLQPAFACALALRAALPGARLLLGGPAAAQLLMRLSGPALARALGPFDAAVLAEGEVALPAICARVARGAALAGIPGTAVRTSAGVEVTPAAGPLDLATLPAPDFAGLPLEGYLAPAPVLPYDPTRGCFWGKCAFCHYGLTDRGTAPYRERPAATVVAHLAALAAQGVRHIYLSHDSVRPATLEALCGAVRAAGLDLRFGTDLRPERSLAPERCAALHAGGVRATALGIESGDARVLGLMDKGVTPAGARAAMRALAGAGIAVEAMLMTGFPTETAAEARATVRLVEEEREHVALFMMSEFGLMAGARVAHEPARYGLAEVYRVAGDELGTVLFARPGPPHHARVDEALDHAARSWAMRPYPWAGALSTAHSLLYYDRFGPAVFRDLARHPAPPPPRGPRLGRLRYDPDAVAAQAEEGEGAIWEELVERRRAVSRHAYDELARQLPSVRPRRVR